MCRAPAWRATATDMQPIGPAPVTSTSSPNTGNERAVNGIAERIEDRRNLVVDPGQWCHTFVIGSDTSSANAPGRCTPRPIECAHR